MVMQSLFFTGNFKHNEHVLQQEINKKQKEQLGEEGTKFDINIRHSKQKKKEKGKMYRYLFLQNQWVLLITLVHFDKQSTACSVVKPIILETCH